MPKLDISTQLELQEEQEQEELDKTDIRDERNFMHYSYDWYLEYESDKWDEWAKARNLPLNYHFTWNSKFTPYRTYGKISRTEYGHYRTYQSYQTKLRLTPKKGA